MKHRKKFLIIFSIVLLHFFVSACAPAPKYTYQDNVSNTLLVSGKNTQSRVSAAVEEWRNSGVLIEAGKTYRVTAKGQWRTYPTCNFTGPDGIGLYKDWCVKSPLFPAFIEGYSHSTLIARIGETGSPFVVGAELEFVAKDNGPLFLRINDTVNANFDNEGFVDAEIVARQTVSAQPAIAPQLAANLLDHSAHTDAETAQFSSLKQKIPADVLGSMVSRRTALVIGNSNYAYSPLKNPVNDAQAMTLALEELGFDVTMELNANQEKMELAIDEFGRRLISGHQVGLFYYAGHGVQVDGANYLIPVDALIKRQSDVRYKAINIGQVLGAMGEAKDNLNIVILDACRDNPLPRSFRGGSRGLARVESPKGTIIGFATSPGSTAADGEGDNGLYTKHLLRNVRKGGLSIEQVFKKVLQGVNEETSGQQVPWTESSFTGDFTFSPQ